MKPYLVIYLIIFLSYTEISAQKLKEKVLKKLESEASDYQSIAMEIWENPELGYLEENSSALLSNTLEEEGFAVKRGVAAIPTAFTATFGQGKPVIGILGEFDALPGMSQKAEPKQEPRIPGGAGHACGHHLFGTGSMAAAIAIKDWLKQTGKSGTIRFYGTPAEESGSGKVYMVRAGLFDDVDAVISWHPGDANKANPGTSLANISGKFRFKGVSAHAAVAPERGRSALDGIEAMNDMVNMLREHTTESTRIHYVITKGGQAPNIVPAEAEVYYQARHEDREELRSIWNRIVKAAEGAAMGTETTVTYEILGGTYNQLPNEALSKILHRNLEQVGGVEYTEEEKEFARSIQETYGQANHPLDNAKVIQPMEMRHGKHSADTGDVSWTVPTAGIGTATWVPGTPPHSWQAVAAGGTSIGYKGMMIAAKTLALAAIDIFSEPGLLEDVKKEFQQRRGEDFQYQALLGDREPPLDYRK